MRKRSFFSHLSVILLCLSLSLSGCSAPEGFSLYDESYVSSDKDKSPSSESGAVTESSDPTGTEDAGEVSLTVGAGDDAETETTPDYADSTEDDTASENAPASGDDQAVDDVASIDSAFYSEVLSDDLKEYITGKSYPSKDNQKNMVINYDDLRHIHILHYDKDGNSVEGELICNKSIAEDLLVIFRQLYEAQYRIEKVRLVDEYGGDDDASMADNNTSCFNYRVVPGSTSISKHAYGLAIDINPYYNPYVTGIKTGDIKISPAGAETYADRSLDFEYKIDENDLCCKLFKEHGFTWGGNWTSVKDYQHFEKSP